MDHVAQVKALLDRCSEQEQRQVLSLLRERHPVHPIEQKFGASAEIILEAIDRASDLSQRGVLGLIAEASFQVNVIDRLVAWVSDPPSSDEPFDYRLRRGSETVRIQVKRQRLVKGKPMRYRGGSTLYVAETQRSRGGTNSQTGEETRPYRFGEFDILAVCMQPVTNDWSSFRFTPQRWLIPRTENPAYLRVLQPVSLEPNDDWADGLETCIKWFVSGANRTIRER